MERKLGLWYGMWSWHNVCASVFILVTNGAYRKSCACLIGSKTQDIRHSFFCIAFYLLVKHGWKWFASLHFIFHYAFKNRSLIFSQSFGNCKSNFRLRHYLILYALLDNCGTYSNIVGCGIWLVGLINEYFLLYKWLFCFRIRKIRLVFHIFVLSLCTVDTW